MSIRTRANMALQPTAYSPARSSLRFQRRLSFGVAMTSNVKSREQLFLGLHDFFVLGASEKPEPVRYDG
jgi:hypothetical protein